MTDIRTDSERDDAPVAPPPVTGGDRRRPSRRVLTLVAVLGVAGTIVFGGLWAGERREDARADAVRDTARDFLVALTNFDGESIDADFDRIESYATGDFAEQTDRFFGGEVRQAIKQVEGSSRGEIRSVYVQEIDGDRARVFAVVDQTVSNNRLPAPQPDELRVELTLRRTAGAWRVADVRVLQAPPASVAAGVGGPASPPNG